MKVLKIKESALKFALIASKKLYPREFSGLLRGRENLIEEILVMPGTIYGKNFSMQRMDMKPIDSSIIGSVHSHPGRNFYPSNEDLNFFRKFGFIHLILAYPYESIRNVKAYDKFGNEIKLEIYSLK